MATDQIRYDLLAQDALRGLVRKVLTDAAKSGLPGEHHFSISFRTDADGAKLSPRLREQFPQEMTIILQYQFWDLKVTDTAFEVGLSFGGIPEKLVVPFAAIKSFFDPSVQFGLQFETIEMVEPSALSAVPADGSAPAAIAPLPEPAKSETARFDAAKSGSARSDAGKTDATKSDSTKSDSAKSDSAKSDSAKSDSAKSDSAKSDSAKSDGAPADKPSGEVVRLDRFRKK